MVRVEKDQQIPADLVLLYSGEEKGNCFVETKNLDGETNLKEKRVSPKLLELFAGRAPQELGALGLRFRFERPNPYLYSFSGSVELPDGATLPLDNGGFVLRGCVLRNTECIFGLVTYNGHEAKVMLNSVKAQAKMSLLERMMNRQIIYVAALQMSTCFLFAVLSVIYQQLYQHTLRYMEFDKDRSIGSGEGWFVDWPIYLGKWLLILNGFIPISLMVSHEMVKYFQADVVAKDPAMKSTFYGDIAAEVQSSSLTEELGQIDYIFSDKTGTLTCNVMDFKKLYSFGEVYGEEYDIKAGREFKTLPNVSVRDPKLFQVLADPAHPQRAQLARTLEFLGLCHTALVEGEGAAMKYCVGVAEPD